MTTDRKRLRELLANATPGPWKEGNCDFYVDDSDGDDLVLGCVGQAGGFRSREYSVERGRKSKMLANNALIVAAVAALPSLLDQIDALEARVAEAEGKTSGILEVKLVDQNGMEVDSKGRFYRDLLKEEAWRDENGAIWTRPTARAYARVYQARDNHQQRAEAAERQRDEAVKVLKGFVRSLTGQGRNRGHVLSVNHDELCKLIDGGRATISKIEGKSE